MKDISSVKYQPFLETLDKANLEHPRLSVKQEETPVNLTTEKKSMKAIALVIAGVIGVSLFGYFLPQIFGSSWGELGKALSSDTKVDEEPPPQGLSDAQIAMCTGKIEALNILRVGSFFEQGCTFELEGHLAKAVEQYQQGSKHGDTRSKAALERLVEAIPKEQFDGILSPENLKPKVVTEKETDQEEIGEAETYWGNVLKEKEEFLGKPFPSPSGGKAAKFEAQKLL